MDTKLYKLVSTTSEFSSPSLTTAYWFNQEQRNLIRAYPERVNEILGLPAGSQANSFNLFEIQPQPNTIPTIYQSQVATTTEASGLTSVGNASQTIVPNRSLWTTPKSTGEVIKTESSVSSQGEKIVTPEVKASAIEVKSGTEGAANTTVVRSGENVTYHVGKDGQTIPSNLYNTSTGKYTGVVNESGGSLSGMPTNIGALDDAVTTRSLIRENGSAVKLSENGYTVEQNPVIDGTAKKPDYRINGEVFDNYAPETASVRNMAGVIEGKVNSGQANNVVVNLAGSTATPAALRAQLINYPVPGLKQVIVIDQSGGITVIKLTGK